MNLERNVFIEASNAYECSIDDSYKKTNGIFYTDYYLAERMLLELKSDRNARILDPCCGTGVFLYAARKNGYTNLYGTDIDPSAIQFCKDRITDGDFAVFDSIGRESRDTLSIVAMTDKADVVIGNPPYVPLGQEAPLNSTYLFRRRVSDSGNNLFVAALMRAFDLVKEGGIVTYILPKNYLHVASYGLSRRELLKEKTIVSIVDLGAFFKNVRGEQIVLTVKNATAENKHKIKIKKLSSNRFVNLSSIPQNFYKDEILLFNCQEDFSIYSKLTSSYQNISDLCKGYVGRGKSKEKHAIIGKEIRKFGYKNQVIPKHGNQLFIQNIYSAEAGIIAAFGGSLQASQTVTIFTDGDERMCRYILGILHSRLCNLFLYKYCFNYSKLTMHTDAKYLKKIPLPSQRNQEQFFDSILSIVTRLETDEYMSPEWFVSLEELNATVYKAYSMNKEESDYIDDEVKRIQSRRWSTND